MPYNPEREIDDCLDDIKNAVFGEQVRDAFIEAIQLCYNDILTYVTEHTLRGKSAFEIAQEKGYAGTISDWLASLKGDPGPQGPQGPQGPPGEIHGDTITVDGEISGTSQNPVQNRVIKQEFDKIMQTRPFGSGTVVGSILNVSPSKRIGVSSRVFGSDNFAYPLGNTKIPSELSVSRYTYSKLESNSTFATKNELNAKANSSDVYDKNASDTRYVQKTDVDSEISSTSPNPISNRAVYDAIQNIEISVTLPIDDELDINSEHAVQNKVITNLTGNLDHNIQQALMTANQKTSRDDVFNIIDEVLTTSDANVPRLTVEEYNNECWLVYYDSTDEEPHYLANISEVLNNLNS